MSEFIRIFCISSFYFRFVFCQLHFTFGLYTWNLLMATCAINESTLCSICFDSFKTPRYLPGKHSFCHHCLFSYIDNHHKTTVSREGFHCPLCRDYIPNICATDNSEELVRFFPENRILEKCVSSLGQKFCEACLRESEEEEATHFCLNCIEKLCGNCTKCHKID